MFYHCSMFAAFWRTKAIASYCINMHHSFKKPNSHLPCVLFDTVISYKITATIIIQFFIKFVVCTTSLNHEKSSTTNAIAQMRKVIFDYSMTQKNKKINSDCHKDRH